MYEALTPETLLAAIFLGGGAGALASPHCAAMCGPLVAFACGTSQRRPLGWLMGRTSAYAMLGAVAGGFFGAVASTLGGGVVGFVTSMALALALLMVGARWMRPAPVPVPLARSAPPTRLKALMRRALLSPAAPYFLGALSAVLPCGVLWAAVAAASATGHPVLGATAMISFSVASAPALYVSGWLAKGLDPRARQVLGAVMCMGALVLVLRPVLAARSQDGASCHSPSRGEAMSEMVSP